MSDTVKFVTFYGESFALEGTPSEWALMEFAEVAETGIDDESLVGMAGVKRLVESCLREKELPRFRATARKNRATTEKLMEVLTAAYEGAERPTGLSSDSSDGQDSTEAKSDVKPADKGSDIYAGRPDLQLALIRSKSA